MISSIATPTSLKAYARMAQEPAIPTTVPASPQDKATIGKHKTGPIAKFAGTILAGIGLGSGATGGALLGGSVFSAGSLMKGLIAHNFSFATASHAGLVGAGIGAVVFGIAGAYGGWTMADLADRAVEWTKEKANGSKP